LFTVSPTWAQNPHLRARFGERWDTTYKQMIESTPEKTREWAGLSPSAAAGGAPEKEVIVAKVPGCVSAMKSKGLLPLLKDKYKVESLVICALTTSGALLSTAREAADLEFVTTVVKRVAGFTILRAIGLS
jgi:nicotinamidase-related amidase